MRQDVATPSLPRLAALVGCALFLLIGATTAIFGPTIPSFRSTFHLTASAAGLLLSGHFAGSLLGTLSPSFLPRRFRAPRPLAGASTLCFALGCLAISSALTWPMAVAGAVVEGTGWGGLVIAFNALFATGFGPRSPTMLTLLNAVFGVGAMFGPAGVGLLAGGNFRLPFLTVAAAALVLLPLGLTLPREELVPAPLHARGTDSLAVLMRPLAWFMVAFFLYGGLEAGMGAWETTQLVATGSSVAAAATITALFWTSYTVGRLVAAPLALVVKPEQLVLGCLAAVGILALCAQAAVITAAAYTACGLALGPIFPLALVWSGRLLHASQRVTSLVISGDLLGGTVLAALLGQLVTDVGAGALPLAFATLAAGAGGTLLVVQLGGTGVPTMEVT